jgi:hypothetical protein
MMTTEEILEATEQLTDEQREILIGLLQKRRVETKHEQTPKFRQPRQPGMLAGRLKIAEDFDAPLPEEIMVAFRGETP